MLIPHLPQRSRVVLPSPAVAKPDGGFAFPPATASGAGKGGVACVLPVLGGLAGDNGLKAAGNKYSQSQGCQQGHDGARGFS